MDGASLAFDSHLPAYIPAWVGRRTAAQTAKVDGFADAWNHCHEIVKGALPLPNYLNLGPVDAIWERGCASRVQFFFSMASLRPHSCGEPCVRGGQVYSFGEYFSIARWLCLPSVSV